MEDDEGAASAVAIGKVCCQKDSKESSKVGWRGESLRSQSGIAHPYRSECARKIESVDILFDDGW